ncbi:hypothetical protein BTO05_05410 [Winogradskyella sp. PC-19]|uniref:DUF3667 domain-containing protein n=1 Tax=unclassified Winogradskyella TaxID=2615021 RepID=UPI000B3CFDE3|nr:MULTISPECIES: DUF3667 domain-containing protein [unclassified Winogradskyella]ARV09099.1 hypothetical protein BTO05_05410 [Winogradskyella sp. PC-19]RZN76608.1 MAG: DUF3667 domain-containing protein [Winogradskyella sp.]
MVCKNCNKQLLDTQKFCDECGAKVIQNRLTPKILTQQINEEFISIDNKFLRTFIGLFKRPENVINGYIYGTRKKYINVLQYFAIGLTLAGIQFYIMKTFFIEQLENPFQFTGELKESNESTQKTIERFIGDGGNFQSLTYILSVPFSAVGTWLTYKFTGFKKFNFTEHVVINLYYSAQVIITSSILYIIASAVGINFLVSSILISLIIFFYQAYVFKRVTNHSSLESIARIIVSYFVVGIQVIILLMIFFLVAIILKTTNII